MYCSLNDSVLITALRWHSPQYQYQFIWAQLQYKQTSNHTPQKTNHIRTAFILFPGGHLK